MFYNYIMTVHGFWVSPKTKNIIYDIHYGMHVVVSMLLILACNSTYVHYYACELYCRTILD